MTLSELRQTLRTLAARPGLALLIALTLAVGIGSATAVADFVNLLAWRLVPAADPTGLVKIYSRHAQAFIGDWGGTRVGDVRTYAEEARSLVAATSVVERHELVDTGSETRELAVGAVDGGFFELLGVEAALGRLPGPEDDRFGAPLVAVVSERLWRREGADPELLGRSFDLSGTTATVVGVVPRELTGVVAGTHFDVWIPLRPSLAISGTPTSSALDGLNATVLARLRPGVTRRSATEELRAIASRLDRTDPLDAEMVRHPTVAAAAIGHPIDLVRLAPSLKLFALASTLLLVLSCANVSHLLLARAAGRRREMAIRQAIGAHRARLVQQLLVEGGVLALLGGAGGLVVTLVARRSLAAVASAEFAAEARFDHRVLGVSLVVCLGATLLFGLAPALFATRFDHASTLRASGSAAGRGTRSRLSAGGALGVVQIALAVALLGSGALLLRSLDHLRDADLGFDDTALGTTFVEAPRHVGGPAEWLALQDRILHAVRGVAGVENAAFSLLHPPTFLDVEMRFRIENDARNGPARKARFDVVSPEYFDTAGIRLAAGRSFDATDAEGPGVAVVTRRFARETWGSADPLGERLTTVRTRPTDRTSEARVVGVMEDIRQFGGATGPEPVMFFPSGQRPRSSLTLVLRASRPLEQLADPIRDVLRALEPGLVVGEIQTSRTRRENALSVETLQSRSVAALAGVGLFLATLGIYGVLAAAVAVRTREIGVRLALGATPARIHRQVLGRSARLLALGVLLGGLGLAGSSRLLASQLHGIELTDVTTHSSVVLLVVATGLLAAQPSALRAARVDPATALRSE